MILLIALQVLGQVVDPLCQQRNLDIRRTGVRLMKAISFDCVSLLFHSFQSLCLSSLIEKAGQSTSKNHVVKHFNRVFYDSETDPPAALGQAGPGYARRLAKTQY